MNASASCLSTMIGVVLGHLVCCCSHWLCGKVYWHWTEAQGQTGSRPEQMATSFTCNTTQWQAGVEITPLSNNKNIPGSLGDPFSACSLFNYMWIPVYWERESERELWRDRDVVKPSALLSVALPPSWHKAVAFWWLILTIRLARSLGYLQGSTFNLLCNRDRFAFVILTHMK